MPTTFDPDAENVLPDSDNWDHVEEDMIALGQNEELYRLEMVTLRDWIGRYVDLLGPGEALRRLARHPDS